MIGWVLFLLVLAGLVSIPWVMESDRHEAAAFRDKAPGRFAKLSQGVTHYQWLGPARGPVVVAIHGLTTPSPVWYAIAEKLTGLGYRVLVYDLYGRGFSDAPKGVQDAAFFCKQLDDLLEHQEIKDDVTLLGYSMGGSIATSFAAAHPDRMRRLMLMAPGGVWLREDWLTRWSRSIPLLGDWVHAVIGTRRARRSLRKQLGQRFEINGIIELQLAEFQSKGFIRSVLSSRRNMLAEVQENAHQILGRAAVPVVAIWAERDGVIPLRSLGTLTQWNRAVRQEVIEGADHQFAYTHSTEIVSVLRDVLREDHQG